MVKSCNRGNKLYRCSYLGHSGEPCCEQIVHRRCWFAMECFRNRLPHVGCQVYVQDSIGVRLLFTSLMMIFLKKTESYSVLSFTTCFLLARDHCATWCTLAELFCSMYNWFCIAANMVMIDDNACEHRETG